MQIRDAVAGDAKDLAFLTDVAGEGLPGYLWRGMAEGGESPLEVGTRRVARGEGNFSYANARVCVDGDAVLGMMLAYRLPDPHDPGPLSGYPEMVRPLLALESLAPGTWYINAVASYEAHRGKGVGRRLIADAEDRARAHGCNRLSLIVASENPRARSLYERSGFAPVATRPVVAYPGGPHGGEWVLMVKRLA